MEKADEGEQSVSRLAPATGAQPRSGPSLWPRRLLGPLPGIKEINLICWGLFVVCLLAPYCVFLWIRVRQGAACDFVFFYGIGRLFNAHPSTSLYNVGLQLRTFDHILVLHHTKYGPSPYPPFVAQFFSLLAGFSFRTAFLIWLVISLALYLLGVSLTAAGAFPGKRVERSLMFCLALSFCPFVFHTLADGQIASIGFCAISCAIFLDRRNKPILSGLALSILTYKPTLLILLLPMLLVTRRLKTLLGFAGGAVLLLLEVTLVEGPGIWPAYLRLIAAFQRLTAAHGQLPLRYWQFVDLNSLTHAIPSGRSQFALGFTIAVAVGVVVWLASLLWRSPAMGQQTQMLVWATVLTWTLLLNVYVPIYDSANAVIAVMLTLGALQQLEWFKAMRWMVALAVLIFAVSWFTVFVAQRYYIQPLTVVLFFFGLLQLAILRRAIQSCAAERKLSLEPAQA